MEFTEDFNLELGERLIFKKINGHKTLEFSRHPDEVLDNIVEFWHYDSRKSKGKSTWIVAKDLHLFISPYAKNEEYEVILEGTNKKKKSKKQ